MSNTTSSWEFIKGVLAIVSLGAIIGCSIGAFIGTAYLTFRWIAGLC